MTTSLTSAFFSSMSDSIFWNELRAARIDADCEWLADAIAKEVISGAGNAQRRATFAEELVDRESWIAFVNDLLDDVARGVDPSETIKKRVKGWALDVAQYEISRGEA